MKASTLSFQVAVLFVLIGMAWGIQMAISQNHAAMPAHAHLNLLGWVSLFLMGIYYRLHPALDGARSAFVQVWTWILGTVVLTAGVGMLHSGVESGEPLAAVGSFIALFGMLLFGWQVVRVGRVENAGELAASPAE